MSETLPHVLKFAERMEAKLALNRHKGDREGWLAASVEDLMERLLQEVVEVQEACKAGDAKQMADECADVANFAMMIADWYQERERVWREAQYSK